MYGRQIERRGESALNTCVRERHRAVCGMTFGRPTLTTGVADR